MVGGIVGLLAGFYGGWIDSMLMRLVDFTLAMPYLVLVIAIVAVLGTTPVEVPGFGPLPVNVLYAIWLIGWVTYARMVRGEMLVARRSWSTSMRRAFAGRARPGSCSGISCRMWWRS